MTNEPKPSGFLLTDGVVDGRRRLLGRWKVVSDRAAVIEAFRDAYGGEVQSTEGSGTRSLLLEADEITALVPGGTSPEFSVGSNKAGMAHHMRNGEAISHSDGATGDSCGCLADRSCGEAHAQRSLGPPRVRLPFRPFARPEVGSVILASHSFSLIRSLHDMKHNLVGAEHDVQIRFRIRREAFVTRSGIDVRLIHPEALLASAR